MPNMIDLEVFVRQLHRDVRDRDGRYVFFLGAGCSISSEIDAAGRLTERWVGTLVEEQGRPIKALVGDYDPSNPAASYGAVMEKLFPRAHLRQQEIEHICGRAVLGFGYAALAALFAHPRYSNSFSSILTTNFDDLIQEAFYRHTTVRPLIIDHESLAGFVRSNGRTPVVVKLHGDHRLAPRNTKAELESLAGDIKDAVRRLLEERGIIFVGYSGNDKGVADVLDQFGTERLRRVYWVNKAEPGPMLRPVLNKHSFEWVDHLDFDHFMLTIQREFAVGHPDRQQLQSTTKEYVLSFFGVAEKAVTDNPDAANAWQGLKKSIVDSGYLSADGYLLLQDRPDLDDDTIRDLVVGAEFRIRDRFLEKQFQKTRDWAWVIQRANLLLTEAASCADEGIAHKLIEDARAAFESGVEQLPGCVDLILEYAKFLANHVDDGAALAAEQCDRVLAVESQHAAARKLRDDLMAAGARSSESASDRGTMYDENPNWAANATDDVVIAMHPQSVGAWRSALPNGTELHLLEREVETPPANWHITEPRTSQHWTEVARRIEERIAEIERIPCKRVHVFANGPYALGALLGNRLAQRVGRSHGLVFYQYNPNTRSWEDWGPSRRLRAAPREQPFLTSSLADKPAEGVQHVVLALHVSRELSKEEIGQALTQEAGDGPFAWVDARPVDGSGQQALREPSAVDRCAADIDDLLFRAARLLAVAVSCQEGDAVVLSHAAGTWHVASKCA